MTITVALLISYFSISENVSKHNMLTCTGVRGGREGGREAVSGGDGDGVSYRLYWCERDTTLKQH